MPLRNSQILREAEDAIRGNLQARASALVHYYGTRGHPEQAVFDLLAKFSVSEDGALHTEKYFGTVREEFSATRAWSAGATSPAWPASPPANSDAPPRVRRKQESCWASRVRSERLPGKTFSHPAAPFTRSRKIPKFSAFSGA